ncbi:MAG: thiolase domain-containing protein [Candidatus Jordarchaeaceae archaeon]
MRKVAVVGVGMTKFGALYDQDVKELTEEAVWKALQDGGVDPKDIQIAYCGNAVPGVVSRQAGITGQIGLMSVGITGIPITTISNACSSSTCAFRETYFAIATGLYDIGLAFGVEKTVMRKEEATMATLAIGSKFLSLGADGELENIYGISFPGFFANAAQRHMHLYGTTREQMAKVAVKNHHNATMNPYAQFQKEITIEDVFKSRMVAYPLTVYDCCPLSDGASAAILVGEELAKKYTDTPIWIKGTGQASGVYSNTEEDLTRFLPTIMASRDAYKQAKIEPKDVDFAEVHDCFTISEIIHYEDLGWCKKGEGGKMIEEGITELGGKLPVNPGGGLKARGHPVAATGTAQIAELVWQLRGEAGKRQVDGAEIGLAHTLGGLTHADVAVSAVVILGRE